MHRGKHLGASAAKSEQLALEERLPGLKDCGGSRDPKVKRWTEDFSCFFSLHAFTFTYTCHTARRTTTGHVEISLHAGPFHTATSPTGGGGELRPVCISTVKASQTVPGVEDRAHLWCGRLGCSYAWSLAKPTIAAPVHRPSSIHNPPSVDPVPGRLDHRVRLPHRYVDHSTSG